MFKLLFILVVGVAIGYSFGWKDAKKNKETVVERMVHRVGGKNRGAYDTNLDKRAESVAR